MLSASGSAAAGPDDHFDACTVTGFAPLRDRAIPSCAQRPRHIPTRLRRSGPLGDKGPQPQDCWLRRDRALFDAVQQKLTEQWTTRSTTRNASDHLLTGLLFDDAGHRMVPTHATKAGVRYRYYVSLPHLYGESKTASVGSVSRIPAIDIEDTIVNSLNKRLIVQKEKPNSSITRPDRKVILERVARIDVHEDRLAIRLKPAGDEETPDAADDLLSIPWLKPPS